VKNFGLFLLLFEYRRYKIWVLRRRKIMKKIALIAVLLISICAISSFAQPRIDVGIDIPFYFGIKTDSSSSSIGDYSKYAFLLPEIDGSYVFNLGPIGLGIGIRMFSFIIETIGWPNLFLEANLGPVILSAEVGGGWYFLFGISTMSGTGAIVLGDLSAAFKFTDWFRAGIGVFGIGDADPNSPFAQSGVIPFAVYAFAKFSFDLGPKEKAADKTE
jgi:hypothetical protein